MGAVLSIPLTLLVRSVLLETDPSTAWARALIAYGSAGKGDPGEKTPTGSSNGSPAHRPEQLVPEPPATV